MAKTPFLALAAALLAGACSAPGAELAGCRAAAEYSRQQHGVSLVVLLDGQVVCEDYAPSWKASSKGPMASGVKSFSTALAAAAVQDGLLALQERAADTLPEWRDDPAKREITLRQLLSLSSGLRTDLAEPTTQQALEADVYGSPGTWFAYDPAPFQVFGEILRRKLAAAGGESVDAYFERRIARPLGIEVEWLRLSDGTVDLAGGGGITARDWARYGELIRLGGAWEGKQVLDAAALTEALGWSGANPAYVMGWWRPGYPGRSLPTSNAWQSVLARPDTLLAVGAGKQRLFVSPSSKMVIARQAMGEPWSRGAASTGFSDVQFLTLLMAPAAPG